MKSMLFNKIKIEYYILYDKVYYIKMNDIILVISLIMLCYIPMVRNEIVYERRQHYGLLAPTLSHICRLLILSFFGFSILCLTIKIIQSIYS